MLDDPTPRFHNFQRSSEHLIIVYLRVATLVFPETQECMLNSSPSTRFLHIQHHTKPITGFQAGGPPPCSGTLSTITKSVPLFSMLTTSTAPSRRGVGQFRICYYIELYILTFWLPARAQDQGSKLLLALAFRSLSLIGIPGGSLFYKGIITFILAGFSLILTWL